MPSTGYKSSQTTTSYNNYNYSSSGKLSNGQNSTSEVEEELGRRTNPGIYSEGGKYGISDMFGKRITNPVYDDAKYFSWDQISKGSKYWSGTILVKSKGKWGIHNSYTNNLIVPIIYDEIRKVDKWSAWVKSDGKVGLISLNVSDSKISIPVIYDEIGTSAGNYFIWLRIGKKYGLVNNIFNKVLGVEYDAITEYSLNTLIVMNNKEYGLTNYAGDILLPIAYDYITPPVDGMAWTLKDGKWGIITEYGIIKAAPQFDSLYQQKDGALWVNNIAAVSKNGSIVYINKLGEDINLKIDRIVKMEENFESNNSYKWPAFESCIIKDGHYEISTTEKHRPGNVRYIPFPKEVRFTANEDWLLEMSIRKVTGYQSTNMGIMIESPDLSVSTFNFSCFTSIKKEPKAMVNFRYKGLKNIFKGESANPDFNTIKITKKSNEIKAYFNNKVISKEKLDTKDITDGRLYLKIEEPSSPDEIATFHFDDIHFEIIK